MPYLGNTASNRFVASESATQFSGDGSTTAFTLDHSVGSDEDILVSVDGVIQEPSVAYSVSGTTLTFTAAPSNNSGNNIFVYYLFRTVGTVSHPSNNALTATSGTFTGDITVDTSTLKVDSANNRVGIGTASPSTSLNVVGGEYLQTQDSVDTVLTLTSTSNSGRSYQIRSQNSSGEFYVYDNTAGASRITVDSNGHVTMPSQSAFHAAGTDGSQSNVTVGSLVTVKYDSERFDQNLDFNNSTYTFTAPVTGKYYLHAQVYVNSIDSAATYYSLRITTSNKDYISIYNYTHSDLNYITFQIDVLADMDASDTAVVGFLQPDGTAQTDIQDNASYTFFCGHLVC